MTTNIVSSTPIEHRDSWRTPPYIVAWARHLLGGIDYDTACTEDNAVATPVWRGRGGDALACDWTARCWCNPPYSDIPPWAMKALGSTAATALLIPTPNGERYYLPLMELAHEVSIVGRLAFIGAAGKAVAGNTRGSSLFLVNVPGFPHGERSVARRDDIAETWGAKP